MKVIGGGGGVGGRGMPLRRGEGCLAGVDVVGAAV